MVVTKFVYITTLRLSQFQLVQYFEGLYMPSYNSNGSSVDLITLVHPGTLFSQS